MQQWRVTVIRALDEGARGGIAERDLVGARCNGRSMEFESANYEVRDAVGAASNPRLRSRIINHTSEGADIVAYGVRPFFTFVVTMVGAVVCTDAA